MGKYWERVIKVAIYDYNVEINKRQIFIMLNYVWRNNDTILRFEYDILNKKDILLEKLQNYDILIVSATAKPYLVDALDERLKEAIRAFVSSGGGFLGICGGAVFASKAFAECKTPFHAIVNRGVLGIADE